MATEVVEKNTISGFPFSARTLEEPYHQFGDGFRRCRTGDRVKFLHQDGFVVGTVIRGLSEKLPMVVLTAEDIWSQTEEERKFWYGDNLEEAEMARRTCYFYSDRALIKD